MLSHVDINNNPQMVDITEKKSTQREASASGIVFLGRDILKYISLGEIQMKKGPVFSTAIVAATMAVKKTSDLIPFCHPIPLENIKIEIKPLDEERVMISCLVGCYGKTGVEMEALTGVHIAALTIHDMCKAMNPSIQVESIKLTHKSGGKTDYESK